MANAFVSPTGFDDPDSGWTNEEKAYDEITTSINYAKSSSLSPGSWSTYLVLTHAALWCDKVRFINWHDSTYEDLQSIDVYYNSAWHNVFENLLTDQAWTEISLGGTYSVTAVRYKARRKTSTGYVWCTEADFHEVEAPPAVGRSFGFIIG